MLARRSDALNPNQGKNVPFNVDVDKRKLRISGLDRLKSVLEAPVHESVSENKMCRPQLSIGVQLD